MWERIEARIRENESEAGDVAPLRRPLLAAIRDAGLTPGEGATKKMAALILPTKELMLWEITKPATNFFLAANWEERARSAGLSPTLVRYDSSNPPSGGRHSALSAGWAFGKENCLRIPVATVVDFTRLASLFSTGPSMKASGNLLRTAVEEAMDAYDRFIATGEHGDVFSRFGEPRDYWVRSTRPRSNRVYPSKPIHFWANGKTPSSGGWGGPSYSAAALHNSGFIIVDENDSPAPIPENRQHLIRDADRIRLCALNYYVDAARERGDDRVVIRAGTLNNEMGLNEAWPNVCQALAGKKFQDLAKVLPPTQDGPDQSTSTTFTYSLKQDGSSQQMKPEASWKQPSATNLILYGPPGTGKTFATAFEAVRICLGDAAAAPLSNDRDALMEAYRRLAVEGRIEFVTFHQSFSYEDFVEGLRPTTEKAKDEDEVSDAPASGGFSLKPHAGMFKRISERARLDTGTAVENRLDRSRNLFKLSLIGNNWRSRLEKSLEDSRMFWGFGGKVDWSMADFDQFEAIKARWLSDHLESDGRSADVSGTWYFRAAVENGDYVVLTVGKNQVVALGRVTGSYEFRPENEEAPHSREVDWIWSDAAGAERSEFYPERFSAFQPIYRLDEEAINWDALESIAYKRDALRPTAGARDFVLIIDEINRANISKVFGELITLLEVDKRLGCQNEVRLRLPYSGTSFGVPPNLHIIGTMNTADRSIALLDTALRRRFTFRELMPDPTRLDENVDGINLRKLLAALNDRIEYLFDREHQIGHAYFTGCRSRADIEEVMRHKVIPLLSEYFYDDWSKVAAVLGDRPFAAKTHFLEAKRLVAPAGLLDDELGEEKVRWSVKTAFDFSEFEAQ